MLAFVFMLTGMDAFSQAAVTTLANTYNKAGAGKATALTIGVTTTSAKFNFPAGIALDPSGTSMFVADYNNNAIRYVYDVGNKSSSITFDIYNNKSGINHPIGVAVDSATNVYVLNYGKNGTDGSLMVFNGSLLINDFYIPSIATNAVKLTKAAAITLDAFNNAYITVNGNTVIRVTPLGVSTVVGVITNAHTSLTGIAYLANGNLAISDAGNNGIWLMNSTNGNANHLTSFHGGNDLTDPSAFNHPEGIVQAGNGILVVADCDNNQVKLVNTTNGSVSRLFGVNSYYWKNAKNLATKGWNDGTVNPVLFLDTVQSRQPYALAIDASGNVYDSETYYDILREATSTGLPPPPLPPLSAPTILSVTTNIGQIILTWSSVNNATSYNVKRTTDTNGSFTTIANVTSTTYTDTNVYGGLTYFYEVSALNGTIEGSNSVVVSAMAPYAPIMNPQIGYIQYVLNANNQLVSVFTPDAQDVFYNDRQIAIVGQSDSVSLYSIANSPSPTNYIAPGPNFIVGGYTNGLSVADASAYVIPISQFYPDSTIRAVGTNINGNPNSSIVSARYQFITYPPTIPPITNSAEFTLSDATTNSGIIYTFDGSDPLTNANAFYAGPNPTNSWEIQPNFTITSNTTFTVRGVKSSPFNYQTSSIVTVTLTVSQYNPNTICFGFASGPGSSQFVASPGQYFVLPVGISLLPDAPPIYGLQFELTLTNLAADIVDPNTIDFISLVGKPDPFDDGYYDTIEPYSFISTSQPANDPAAVAYQGAWYQGLEFTDTNNEDLLGVGWLEVYGRTNLYDTLSQNLLTYPILRGNEPYPTASQAVIGGYSFGIPTNANPGDAYQIQIGRPSATTYPGLSVNAYGIPVFINAPADTNLLGPGSINALKNVTIGQIKYLVGDVYPANWFNAGDFGSSNLVNVDVIRVFDFAAYPIAAPPVKSDLFDALDSCGNLGYTNQFGYYTNASVYPLFTNLVNAVTNYTTVYNTNGVEVSSTPGFVGDYSSTIYLTTYFVSVPYVITNIYQATPPALPTTNIVQTSYPYNIAPAVSTLFDGNDTNINQIAFGDGVLDVCDVYVTFRRSLDSSLLWYERFWTNGQRAADTAIPNHAAHVATKLAAANIVQPHTPGPASNSVPPEVVFTAGNTNGTAGQVVQVPITATIYGNYPLRLLMLNLSVVPVAGAPALTTPVQFAQIATTLGSPYITDSLGNGNYAAVWLNNTSDGATGNGVTGTVTLGTLSVTIPAGAPANSVYGVYFDHASASPNGLASFPNLTSPGTIVCTNSLAN